MHDFIALSAYWDGELPEPEKSRMADHLAACELCQGWVRGVAALTRTIALFPNAPVPEDFLGRVISAIDRQAVPAAPASLGDAMRQLPGFTPKADFLSKLMAKLPVCPPFEDLSAWTDGELAASQAADMERHLSDCGPCRHKVEQLGRLSGAVKALPQPVSPSLTGMVLGLGVCPSRSDLSAWLDGELTVGVDTVAGHVAACSDCAQYVAACRHVGAGMRALPVPVASTPVLCPDRLTLHAYHDGELTVAERAEVQHHAETCGECRRVLGVFDQVSGAVAALPKADAIEGFGFRVAAQLPAREARRPARLWQWPTAMAAGVLAVGLLVYSQLQGADPNSQVATMPTPMQIQQVAHVPQDHLVNVQVRSEDLLLGESADLNASTGLLDEWAQ